ncbi:MAG TPA: rhodanese-like domain-containing protein [Paucimonas sp.]|nr:rhodanese-like domain-containing protein [Paucimonas sp.]
MPSAVSKVPAAPSSEAERHFMAKLGFETDCWDVHASMQDASPDFVLVDVRSPEMYARKHIPGAVNIPHGKMVAAYMSRYPKDTLFVVYCAGPHCNGSTKAALNLSRLGYPVKEMIGGLTGWADEGFAFHSVQDAYAA